MPKRVRFLSSPHPMKLCSNPLFDTLADSRSIFMAGAGGGFDIFSGLPLYFALRGLGKTVHLANLSFAPLPRDSKSRISSACVQVSADTHAISSYFPELQLSRWFRERRGEEVPVYAFPQTGVKPLRAAYRKLARKLRFDTLILIDGGTDSLMRGDEAGLGTPVEDIASIAAAVSVTDVPRKLLCCIGFGVDYYHGVCHAQFLEGVAELTRAGAFYGVTSVLPGMEEVNLFQDALNYANERTPGRASIVGTSISAAVDGQFGDVHASARTEGNKLWINPLMALYWTFDLDAVARRVLYMDAIQDTETYQDLSHRIAAFRGGCRTKPWEEMPV